MNKKISIKKIICLCLTFGVFSNLMGCSANSIKKETPLWMEEPISNEEFLSNKYDKIAEKQGVRLDVLENQHRNSMYSWHTTLFNGGSWSKLAKILQDYNINRLYQEIPDDVLFDAETEVFAQNLYSNGIELVYLIGDRNWVDDGSGDCERKLSLLAEYNENASLPISSVALDVEYYTTKVWKQSPMEGFRAYIDYMKDIKESANSLGLKVIQVIPESLDMVDSLLFEEFISTCCDEISIMNYEKNINLSSVWNEVTVCQKYGIPYESVFETMPNNEQYSVTEEKTFFYDGQETLVDATQLINAVYGSAMGNGYHYLSTIYLMSTGLHFAEFFPYDKNKDSDSISRFGQPISAGVLRLKSASGVTIDAYPYYPNGKDDHEYCYLAIGIEDGEEYSLELLFSDYHVSSTNKKMIIDFDNNSASTKISLKLSHN